MYKPNLYSTDYYHQRGIDNCNHGNCEEAISCFNEVIQRDFTYAEAFNDRGVAKLLCMDYEEAISDFDAALVINPEFGIAYTNRGMAKLKLANLKLESSDGNLLECLEEVQKLKTEAYDDLEKGKQFPKSTRYGRPYLLYTLQPLLTNITKVYNV